MLRCVSRQTRETMELMEKLAILADAAKYDASCASSGVRRKNSKQAGGLGNSTGVGICHSYAPDGRCISLLKILLTNVCIFDCHYCINRASSDVKRARFTTQEVVDLTLDFYRRNYIEGLFLSSGIVRSEDTTMEALTDVARTLRVKHRFRGYIHLKAVPGASPELIEAAARYADRLSANIELPTQEGLDQLAPAKKIATTESTMGQIATLREESREEMKRSRHAPRFVPGGQSTQMIVGATPTNDATLLDRASRLYREHALKRVYYSAFSPIPDASAVLPSKSPPLLREHRLYQADWLMRFYGFEVEEIVPEEAPDLLLDVDPKLAWALRNQHLFPIDVNAAEREELLRIPGVGTRSVERILSTRRHTRLRLEHLRKMGVILKRASPFIVTAGERVPARGGIAALEERQRAFGNPLQVQGELW